MKPQEECNYTNQIETTNNVDTEHSNNKNEEHKTQMNCLMKNPCTKRESDICDSNRYLAENEINIIENKLDIKKRSRRTLSYIDNQSGFQREECKVKTSDILKNQLIRFVRKKIK